MNDNVNHRVEAFMNRVKQVAFIHSPGENTGCEITTHCGAVIYGESSFDQPDLINSETKEAISYGVALKNMVLLDD